MTRESEAALQRMHVVVHGRVQGVNFRFHTLNKAVSLGLRGWVRNTPAGTVETIAEGEEESLRALLAFLQIGSPLASVTHVDIHWEEATGEFDRFQVRYPSF
jgi:acylphosphatase